MIRGCCVRALDACACGVFDWGACDWGEPPCGEPLCGEWSCGVDAGGLAAGGGGTFAGGCSMRPRFIGFIIGAGGANRGNGGADRAFVAGTMRIVHSSLFASAENATETASHSEQSRTPPTEIRRTCRHKAFPLREAARRTGSTSCGPIIIEMCPIEGISSNLSSLSNLHILSEAGQ
jgi:hypothetical protein